MSVPEEGSIDSLAITHHELFESYKRAGFTPQQALWLIGQWIIGGTMSSSEVADAQVPPDDL